jgi:hypothetical protein
MVDIARNFASPINDEVLLQQSIALAGAYTASMARDIAARAKTASLANDMFGSLVEATRGGGLKRPEVWSPELGVARKLARRDDPTAAAVQLTLLLASLGHEGRYCINLGRQHDFMLAGYRVSLSGEITIEADGSDLTITQHDAQGGQSIAMVVQGGGAAWMIAEPSLSSGLVSFSARAPIACGRVSEKFCVGVGQAMNTFDDGAMDDVEVVALMDPKSSAFATAASGEIAKAYELIDAVAPEFSGYVTHLVRGLALIPVPASGDVRRQSGSSMNNPGMPTCTYPCDVDWLAETIVHEASHQYLQLLQRAFPLCTDGEAGRYYSSIKEMYRGLERQLVGYHAVVNMVRFRRALIVNGGENEKRVNELNRFERFAAEMRDELRTATEYTAEGRMFVDELNGVLEGAPAKTLEAVS